MTDINRERELLQEVKTWNRHAKNLSEQLKELVKVQKNTMDALVEIGRIYKENNLPKNVPMEASTPDEPSEGMDNATSST